MNRLAKFVLLVALLTPVYAYSAACATVATNPNDSEVQQTRKVAVQVFQAVEMAGTTLEGIQVMEIQMYENGRVDMETHRAFQTRLLAVSRIVRTGLKQVQMATRMPELRNTVQVLIDALTELRTEFSEAFAGTPLGTGLSLVTSGLAVVVALL